MTTFQRLLNALPSYFNKAPNDSGALTLLYSGGTAAVVTIADHMLMTSVQGGAGGNLSLDLTAYTTMAALVSAINGHTGYTAVAINTDIPMMLKEVENADIRTTALKLFSAVSLLWRVLLVLSWALSDGEVHNVAGLTEMVVTTADSRWLDVWGLTLGNVPRKPAETDGVYAIRLIKEVLRTRLTKRAIQRILLQDMGVFVALTDDQHDSVFVVGVSKVGSVVGGPLAPTNGRFNDRKFLPDRLHSRDIFYVHSDPNDNLTGIKQIIERNKASGIMPVYDHMFALAQINTKATVGSAAFLTAGPPTRLLIAAGGNHLILTSSDGGVTWLTRHAADASNFSLIDAAWNGASTYVLVGDNQIWSSTDGGVTWVSRTVPANTAFNIGTGLGFTGVFKHVIWDGARFIAVGVNTNTAIGIVGTSADGITWNFSNVTGSSRLVGIAFNGTTYVALDWRAFISQNSRIYSSTDLSVWTLRLTSASETEYAWLGTNGSAFLAMASDSGGRVAYSADGLSWAEASGLVVDTSRAQIIWDIPSNQWIAVGFLSPGAGTGALVIATSPTGAVWTTRLNLGTTLPASAGPVLRASGGNLYAWVGNGAGVLQDGKLYVSTDNGMTWTVVGANTFSSQVHDMEWNGSAFAVQAYGNSPSFPDAGLWTAPDGLAWTRRFDDVNGDLIIMRKF